MPDPCLLHGANAAFLEHLYQSWLREPASVDPSWHACFEGLEETGGPEASTTPARSRSLSELAASQARVLQLISALRYRGHGEADLDPLGLYEELYERPSLPDTHPEFYGFGEADMDRIFNTGSVFMPSEATLGEIHSLLRDTYCRSIGTELTHVSSTEQKRWVQERLERARGRPSFDHAKKRDILHWLTAARKLEEYLHRKYVGQKRFSLEGGENLIPMLDEILQRAGAGGVREAIIGMAHRGRLNVLVNILGKHPKTLFGEFEGKVEVGSGSGDVKYHLGFSSDVQTPGGALHLVLAFNPSHLEIINPVVEGSVRARQERRGDHDRNQVLPILVHGDAAFAGQGVVTETLNLSETRGYGTGGTVHIIVNNQIGFTTSDPRDTRSTLYCTDVAKLVQAPIFHVNGNDAEAAVFVAQLALDFRMRFKKDVVLDLVCFRRWGHNEADEPLATQPVMYKKVRMQKGPRRTYVEQLVEEGVLREGEDEELSQAYHEALEQNHVMSRPLVSALPEEFIADWTPYFSTPLAGSGRHHPPARENRVAGVRDVPLPRGIRAASQRAAHPRRPPRDGPRRAAHGLGLRREPRLREPARRRLLGAHSPGQDSQRGTFFHRHAVLHNQKRRGTHTPLQYLFDGQPSFRIINSLLSEEAVLAFEYGFATAEPEALTIWEAQFGDFANGAQVVVDQFLSSCESKWGRFCGLVMFLPHGYDGQGPEHSSARLERYLQLCAEDNMQVCIPSTPAQMFHLLRRQMLRPYRRPLIVMTPKSLLRHRLATSTRSELSGGRFEPRHRRSRPHRPRPGHAPGAVFRKGVLRPRPGAS